MARRLNSAAVLISLAMLASGAAAQQKSELTGIIGRTFIADQRVLGVSASDTILHSGKGTTFELNYARRLKDAGIVALTVEVPLVGNFDEDIHFSANLVPEGYKSYFLTPSVRANLFPDAGLSPWVSVGGGFGHFSESSSLESGGPNPGKKGSSSGVFQIGGGFDARVRDRFSVRGEVRDFFSGVPQLNVNTGKTRQHNLFVGAGIVWRF